MFFKKNSEQFDEGYRAAETCMCSTIAQYGSVEGLYADEDLAAHISEYDPISQKCAFRIFQKRCSDPKRKFGLFWKGWETYILDWKRAVMVNW